MTAREPDNEGNLPETQSCRLVEIDREIETVEKVRVIYDVICEESYAEAMGSNGQSKV
jgi:hypothetical protein